MEILKKGIDVSSFQKSIDWQAVKNSGIQFAILRSSYGSPDPKQVDETFHQNVKGCQSVGMPMGVYHYGYAVSVEQAKNEAQFFLDTIKNIKFDYPCFYDVEDSKTMGMLDKQSLTDVINAFCKTVADAGYKAGLYASKSWLENKIDVSQIPYQIWCAQYYKECTYSGKYQIWQYASDGQVNGINDHNCDMDYAYVDYTNEKSTVPSMPIPISKPIVSVPVSTNNIATDKQVNVTYQVRANGNWYSEIVNSNNFNSMGYAGSIGKPITDVAIKVSDGSVKYRVHTISGRWLGWITDYNLNNGITGYAGNGTPIDAITIYYYTPSSICPYKRATYRVSPVYSNYYSYQHDDQTINSQDGYAGCFGQKIDRLQINIE